MLSRRSTAVCRIPSLAAAGCAVALVVLGCRHSDPASGPAPATRACGDTTRAYRTKGRELAGDVDGDGRDDRVTLRADEAHPPSCRHVLVVELGDRIATALVRPLAWPGTDPELLLLAEIDGRRGVEPVITLSPFNAYRPGAIFAARAGRLVRLGLGGVDPPELFPLDDEFPAGVDCTAQPGAIVVTQGGLAEGGADDRHWDLTRSVHRSAGIRFRLLRVERFRVEVGREAERRWPELGGHSFRSCPELVD